MRPSRSTLAVAVTFAILAVSSAALQAQEEAEDGVRIDFLKEYYPILGTSWSQVWQTIQRSGVSAGGDPTRFEGVTSYTLSLQPTSQCAADNAWIQMKMVVKVPGLPPTTNLRGDSQLCWARYERWLADHEEWHVKIARRDALELLAAIRSSRSVSCGKLRSLAQRRFTEMQATQEQYDRVSVHGLQQWRAFGLDRNPDAEDAVLRQKCEMLAGQQ